MCWPDYDVSWPCDVLEGYGGNACAYIGEGYGGCTGDDHSHRTLEEHWKDVVRISIPQWTGIHDQLYIFTRKLARRTGDKVKMHACPSCGGAIPVEATGRFKCEFWIVLGTL